MRRLFLPLAAAAIVLLLASSALAAKPPSGSSTGTGSVFVPNPVQSLGDESLTDQKDADAAVPAAAYHDVTLTNLDGSGFLGATSPTSSARPATRRSRRPTPSATPVTRTSSSR